MTLRNLRADVSREESLEMETSSEKFAMRFSQMRIWRHLLQRKSKTWVSLRPHQLSSEERNLAALWDTHLRQFLNGSPLQIYTLMLSFYFSWCRRSITPGPSSLYSLCSHRSLPVKPHISCSWKSKFTETGKADASCRPWATSWSIHSCLFISSALT